MDGSAEWQMDMTRLCSEAYPAPSPDRAEAEAHEGAFLCELCVPVKPR
ncbi:hypothetical protein LRH25_08620 [Ideonella azotifigens]|uniref:Uncharacterized protein n=1 Tax=Ideonella azotifigens TaxID=513160 RepID=A0ABN1KGB7_9BURK|nr:hypothetical protein [Ideonella azotifigens]MCD2340406.1 hypothetical protein [Ideonella azotifigens]